ncbi:MAG TPA: hypothetical protein DCZ04_10730, partial [Syntrophorhabdus aromaticivorans]|nr:hypothetical protein [Syntrophorhabdus aromaticivorans]
MSWMPGKCSIAAWKHTRYPRSSDPPLSTPTGKSRYLSSKQTLGLNRRNIRDMRILGVRFKNLNSLTGEWHIDFTHPAYTSDGIFAITGPTGAGKTTILDAVCLGLYGRTPRLDRVTKSSNEIMSRQAGECFAEVTFETQKGRFRCHWSQHRARKRSEGELQQARHEIADIDSGAVLESKVAQVNELVEKVTGMDF